MNKDGYGKKIFWNCEYDYMDKLLRSMRKQPALLRIFFQLCNEISSAAKYPVPR